eukprot:1741851-Rhodomonas_salina.3
MSGTELARAATRVRGRGTEKAYGDICLRSCYAMYGTGLVFYIWCYAISGTEKAYGACGVQYGDAASTYGAVCLCACYEMVGIDLAHFATRLLEVGTVAYSTKLLEETL